MTLLGSVWLAPGAVVLSQGILCPLPQEIAEVETAGEGGVLRHLAGRGAGGSRYHLPGSPGQLLRPTAASPLPWAPGLQRTCLFPQSSAASRPREAG